MSIRGELRPAVRHDVQNEQRHDEHVTHVHVAHARHAQRPQRVRARPADAPSPLLQRHPPANTKIRQNVFPDPLSVIDPLRVATHSLVWERRASFIRILGDNEVLTAELRMETPGHCE